MTAIRKSYDIFQGERFIESMRSSGYKDTSYAVAELVDNAIDAGAQRINIICHERLNHSTRRHSLYQISVLDDGSGMNSLGLRSALLFGDGTRGRDPKDIGKYGMGLPNASMSQCKRVEVYTWQKSERPICSYIDVDEIKKGDKIVPEPKPVELPQLFQGMEEHVSKVSGTLVVWKNLDRCSWVTSKKIMEHSQFLIGRIYRKFLHSKEITINMITVIVDDVGVASLHNSEKMLPNDPMYLMSPSSTPGEWGAKPMFKKDTIYEEKYPINYEGQNHNVVVRYSIEKDELRTLEKPSQGSKSHGKHARKNIGVSILRASREIALDTHLVVTSEPRDRWWGVEIDIPTALDVAVGLTNNKQQVDVLSAIINAVSLFGDDTTGEDTEAYEFAEQDKSRKELLRMVREINSHIRSMRRRIQLRRRATQKEPNLDRKIERVIDTEREGGKISISDKIREEEEKDQRIKTIAGTLVSEGVGKDEANVTATNLVKDDKKIVFEISKLDGSNFFTVQNTGGILRVKINSNHNAYKNLLLLVEPEGHQGLSDKKRLELTKEGIWLLLASWARYEDLIDNDKRRKIVQDVRFDWGKELESFLEE